MKEELSNAYKLLFLIKKTHCLKVDENNYSRVRQDEITKETGDE